MTPFMRSLSAAAALGTVLFISGCASSSSSASRAPRTQVTMEFSVMESSTEKELTAEQIADLRKAVMKYLREQGLTDGRTYVVKATFPSADPTEEPQWAIVRISAQPERSYQVIAAYPGRDDYYPYDFYRTNYAYSPSYYPSYYGFAGWGYYDPYDYNYGYYQRPNPPRDHNKPDKPDDKKPNHPPGDWTRWTNQPPANGTQPSNSYAPRTTDPDRVPRNRVDARDVTSRSNGRADRTDRTYAPPERSSTQPERTSTSSERSYTPPERSYSPPPERSYTPPPPPPERSYSPPAETSSSRPEPSHGGIQASREQER